MSESTAVKQHIFPVSASLFRGYYRCTPRPFLIFSLRPNIADNSALKKNCRYVELLLLFITITDHDIHTYTVNINEQ